MYQSTTQGVERSFRSEWALKTQVPSQLVTFVVFVH